MIFQIIKIKTAKNQWLIQNFCNPEFTAFDTIIKRNQLKRLLCYKEWLFHYLYQWLSHTGGYQYTGILTIRVVISFSCCMPVDGCSFLALLQYVAGHLQWYFTSMAIIPLVLTFARTSVSLILSAISSIFRWNWKVWHKCSFISLSSLSQKEQVGLKFFKLILLRVSFLCVSVLSETSIFSIPSVSCSFWYSFLFCSNLYLLCLAT